MHSLLIVEDEKIIRDGFTKAISQCGEFLITSVRSAEEALQIIELNSIDVMLLDIKLPGMSGLDFLDYIREQGNEDIIVIVISGYNDFDYAKKAIDLHIFEYILKPVTPDRIRKVVDKVIATLARQYQIKENIQLMRDKISQAKPILKQLFFNDILDDEIDENEVRERAGFLDISLEAASFRVILIKPMRESAVNGEEFSRQIANQNIHEIISNYLWGCSIEVFFLSTSSFAVVQMNSSSEEQFAEDYGSHLKLYYKIMHETGMKSVMGIGNWVRRVCDIKNSYHQAAAALVQYGNSGNTPCLYYNEQNEVTIDNSQKVDKSGEIIAAFINLDEKLLFDVIDRNIVKSAIKEPLLAVDFIVMYLHIVLSAINGYTTSAMEDIRKEVVKNLSALSSGASYEYLDSLKALTSHVISVIRIEKSQINNNLVQKVKKEISQNYAGEIRISNLAGKLGYSPNHLGATFKKETGQTIHDYWHLTRIEMAKDLLKRDSDLISEVAMKVGYNDQYYFSNVFKKYTGINPKEFRNS